jgi:hypothetical protein
MLHAFGVTRRLAIFGPSERIQYSAGGAGRSEMNIHLVAL